MIDIAVLFLVVFLFLLLLELFEFAPMHFGDLQSEIFPPHARAF
jgi:hypothetical protein